MNSSVIRSIASIALGAAAVVYVAAMMMLSHWFDTAVVTPALQTQIGEARLVLSGIFGFIWFTLTAVPPVAAILAWIKICVNER